MKTTIDRHSIPFRMTVFVIILVIGQSLLLLGSIFIGGVLSEAQEDAYSAFSVKVENRKEYIQNEMKNRWTNVAPYVEKISAAYDSNRGSAEAFFFDVQNDLVDMLRTTQVTGAFIILEDESAKHPALYFRDYDPLLNSENLKDLYFIYGPALISQNLGIPLDEVWELGLSLNADNRLFYDMPKSNEALSKTWEHLGYWSTPFKLKQGDIEIMTYTLPMYDRDNQFVGVIGVEISVPYLSKLMPAHDLQPQDSLGYIIGYDDGMSEGIIPLVTNNALQKRLLRLDEPFDFQSVSEVEDIFHLENHRASEPIYASVKRMGLYNYNTPYDEVTWYLIGFMTESDLMAFANRMQRILWTSLFISIVAGAVAGLVISRRFTRPIVALTQKVKNIRVDNATELGRTQFSELDFLSETIENANFKLIEATSKMSRIIDLFDVKIGAFEFNQQSEEVFATDQLKVILGLDDDEASALFNDKGAFLSHIKHAMAQPEPDEENVYRLSEDGRWVKIVLHEADTSVVGIVMDLTEEIVDKNKIKTDRDYDVLTEIYNRGAFQRQVMGILNGDAIKTAALLMFDLDFLKHINDTYGHRYGDLYIKTAAQSLMTFEVKGCVIGRRSGDEFMVFLYDFDSYEEIRKLTHAFYVQLEDNPIALPDGTEMTIKISGGISWIASDVDYETLLHRADLQLYIAKQKNKGSFVEEPLPFGEPRSSEL